jgi:hypothetical protein
LQGSSALPCKTENTRRMVTWDRNVMGAVCTTCFHHGADTHSL